MSTVVFRRRPRQRPPALPRGEVMLESPPEVTETVSGGGMTAALTYLPMLAGGGAMAFMFVRPGSGALGAVIGVLYAVSMAGMLVGQLGRGSTEKKRRLDGERRDYARYLTQVRRRVRRAVAQQHEALAWRGPEPAALWSIAMSSRLWERRPGDEDFGQARIGVGAQQLAVRLVTPQTKPVEDLEPVSAGALRRFVRTHSTIGGLPVSVSLRAFGRVLLDGPPDAVRPLARAVLAQLATFHGPDDLVVAVCAAPDRLAEWDWVKWLPHALHPTRTDAAGPVRLVAATAAGLEDLVPDLRRRGRFTGAGSSAVPHVVVVLDGADLPADSAFAGSDVDGVTLLDLGATQPVDDRPGVLRLEVRTDAVRQVTRDRAGTVRHAPLGRPDALPVTQAEALARLMAPLRTAVGGDADTDATSRDLGLLQLLGLGDARRVDPGLTWRPRPERERLRVPIGVGPTGVPVELDIKEAAQGGMGPHGLVVGATGSGKSELLRSLVLGLAVTHSCETLNFVLVDFKGGATFARLEDLPHTSAVITNLADDLALVDRMKDAIDGELNRRQELLRDAGNYANVKDYERARENGATLPPLPSLFVVVDEFSELLSAKPDFIDLFIMIGRIGRSLGVHLLLASQRLEEGRLRGLDTYLSYRIGLRTFSALESRVVLGVPDAHELPSAPGHGYLKTDPTVPMQRFRSAYVSGPYTGPRTTAAGSAAPASDVLDYSVHQVAPTTAAAAVPAPAAPAAAAPAADAPTVLDVVVDRLVGQGTPARQVWLPPLAAPPTLDRLLPPLVPGEHGLAPAEAAARGGLRVPVGLVDRPYHQRRDPFWLDLSGAGGHVAVVGGPQSGKSTVLRDLVAAFAVTHTPRQVQLYCLDLGGGSLAGLRDLPHVGSVAGRLAPDLVRRTIAEVEGVLVRREKIFEALRVDSMASYRRLREQAGGGPHEPLLDEDPHGDVFLVVDGWGALRTDFEALEAQITTIAARGLTYGVHVVVAATRWMEIRPALRDLLGTRVELRLGDPTESEVDRRLATNVPQGAPGRGLTPQKLHFLSALPRIDGTADVAGLADGVADLVARVRAAWPGAGAPAVRMLPAMLPYAELVAHVRDRGATDRTRPVVGIDENDLAPVHLDLRAEPHLVVLGDTRSGKTNLLRVVVDQVTAGYTPEEAKLVLLDYRHGLLDVADRPHVLAHGFSSAHAAPIVAQVVTGLTKRLPPQDITPDRLAARDWWHGPELFVVVDDYDLVAGGSGSPLLPLLDLLPLARDIGLHVVLARAVGGAGRALFEPVVQRLREAGSPAVLLSGSRDEGPLFGNVRPEPLPPGRGRLVTRQGVRLVQTAYLPAG